ncbi:ABC transporter ATP-binding protein [Stappia stellulata]|uniref:ABC transporter ATP-binding protein n=1 Tax=Stappia stellulata TaxID=71235 RepID=UPI001CD7CB57|nr:ABC transporter ATP-binding protein [Stappia stellulata]MCA1244121.1 ABC transporter ATP-binding protein [Stappia stellulata]
MTDRPDPAPLISLRDVHLSLGHDAGRVHILKGVGLDIAAGETVGIVGPSGSGKSTLLMVMAGLERADSGSVTIGDADLTRLSEDELARFRGRSIGIVFQSFHLIPNMTALENVAVPLELAGHADAFEAARAELAAVGLESRVDHYPAQMSGGEQQRVAIARALVTRPPLLLADEPTGNLDEKTGAQIVELMFKATRERGMTLVLVTHDAGLAKRCDTAIRVRSGLIETVETRAAAVQEA